MTEVSLKIYSWNANQVAHESAKFAYVSKESCVWDSDPGDYYSFSIKRCNTAFS
jgi:hypothetical protein